ncbi:MAG: hypothetical protein D6679_03610 [Candidatus Hydrogenedentota bacterium]|nr:MAG: hypothetical protein D6679_03610 [Candidatus Hydrogenedentota bacterium]
MSRGAVLAWVAGTATIFLLKDWKDSLRRRGVWFLLILLLLLFSGAVRDWNVLTFARQSSIRHRLVIWSAIIPEILAAPVFGHGFNNFHPDPMTVAPPYRNYLVEGRNPHNAYLMAFHAGGIFFYAALWFCYGILFWHLLRRRNLPGSSGRLARVSSGYLVALFVGSFFDKTLFTTLPTLQAWFLAGLALSRSATVEQ